jgi:hypothetical protein
MPDEPKRKGRPLKTEALRAFKIDVRFTKEEYTLITEMARTLGISKTTLVRSKVLHEGKGTIINARQLLRELTDTGAALGRSGNNLNQLAHYANILRLKDILSPVVAERFNLLFEQHLQQRAALEKSLRKLIRTLSG